MYNINVEVISKLTGFIIDQSDLYDKVVFQLQSVCPINMEVTLTYSDLYYMYTIQTGIHRAVVIVGSSKCLLYIDQLYVPWH